mgnify:CR=1 FL=1
MKSGRSLVSLAQELERQLASKKDLVVSSSLLRHDTDDTGDTRLVVEEGSAPVRYGVTPLARRQLEAGSAMGMTCAKLGEAEVLADGGIGDVLIANQVVGRAKMTRLVEVARRINLKVAVDDLAQAEPISQAAAAGPLKGVLAYEDRPLVSVDFKGDPHSAIVDAQSTMVLDGTCVKVLAWYDNEIGYVHRMMELARMVGAHLA